MKKMIALLQSPLHINYIKLGKESLFFLRFFCLVVFFLFFDLLKMIANIWGIRSITQWARPPIKMMRDRTLSVFNSKSENEISSLDLVHLAIRQLKAKKTRTIITIGGMSIGFGSVIFLLSLGYGTQKLVISRVARLDEMKQTTVTTGQASSLRLNDEVIKTFSEIEKVDSVLPMVSVVSKVNYNNSVSDVIVYGVSRAYLEQSAIQPSRGKLFEDSEPTARRNTAESGQVAGVQTSIRADAKMNKPLAQLKYSIYPLEWKTVYAQPSSTSTIIGYTSRVPGPQDAIEVWGQPYPASATHMMAGTDFYGNSFSTWVKDTYPIWEKTECSEENTDCVNGSYQIMRDGLQQSLREGYITEEFVSLERYNVVNENNSVYAEGDFIDSIEFTLPKDNWISIYSDPSKDSEELLLSTSGTSQSTHLTGELYTGESYTSENAWGSATRNARGKTLGLWIKAKVPLWRKVDCQECDTLYLTERDSENNQIYSQVFIKADSVDIENMPRPPLLGGSVLGDSIDLETTSTATDSTSLSTSSSSAELTDSSEIALEDGSTIRAEVGDDGSVNWVSIASGSGELSGPETEVIAFPDTAKKEAIVNLAMLSLLGIDESQAIGKQFSAEIILDQEFFDTPDYQAKSENTDFTIIAIIPDSSNPAYYLPFNDIKSLGISNYSQLRVVSKTPGDLADIRQNIESMGYKTTSVVDTVGKINSLFGTVRVILTLLGLVALGVAALGMFNTLTVSLLEKTREVGLMKAIGMKSSEVQRLFLAESIVMGLSGGIFGLVFSACAGYVLSILLSMLSLSKGLGIINVVYTPLYLAAGIVFTSFIVGVLTGLFPSRRATKISALNALRYE